MKAIAESQNGKPYVWHEIDDLYHEVLKRFYEKNRPDKAAPYAIRLLRLLEMHDPNCEAMLGMSGRSLVAELDGDYEEAIRYRKMELAGVKKLLEEVKPDVLEMMQMDASDYSDRLDLLACLYLDSRQYEAALATLAESEAYCKEHGIPFDGKDVRADVKRAMRKRKKKPATAKAG